MLHIVAVTGMPGAGKSTAARALVAEGWKSVVMGDVIRAETKRRGLEASAKNTGDVMRLLRRERGEAAVADLCLDQIQESGAQRVVIDGIRSMAEVDAFRKKARVLLVAIDASPARRYRLLRRRGRSDDPHTEEMFVSRDTRELGVGIGESIALADETISNQRKTAEELGKEMVKVVINWEKNRG